MLDRRKESRTPTYFGGRVALSPHHGVAECVVRNRSEHGAHLRVDIAAHVPDVFSLSIPQQKTSMQVRACWRHADSMGVEIVGAPNAQGRDQEYGDERIRRLKAENEELRRRLRQFEE